MSFFSFFSLKFYFYTHSHDLPYSVYGWTNSMMIVWYTIYICSKKAAVLHQAVKLVNNNMMIIMLVSRSWAEKTCRDLPRPVESTIWGPLSSGVNGHTLPTATYCANAPLNLNKVFDTWNMFSSQIPVRVVETGLASWVHSILELFFFFFF